MNVSRWHKMNGVEANEHVPWDVYSYRVVYNYAGGKDG